jgi:hypothetical protein
VDQVFTSRMDIESALELQDFDSKALPSQMASTSAGMPKSYTFPHVHHPFVFSTKINIKALLLLVLVDYCITTASALREYIHLMLFFRSPFFFKKKVQKNDTPWRFECL